MRILDRYLLRQFLVPLFYCLLMFMVLWVVFDLLADNLPDFLTARLKFKEIVVFYVLAAPRTLAVVLPLALMLALLYCLSNFSRHNELTAMRASGISVLRLLRPYSIVGLACAVAVFFVSEKVVSRSFSKANDFISWKKNRKRIVKPFCYINAAANRDWVASEFSIAQGEELTSAELKGVTVWVWTARKQKVRMYLAESAQWREGAWWFFNVKVVPFDANGDPAPGFREIPPLAQLRVPDFEETPEAMNRAATLFKPEKLSTAEIKRRMDDPISPPTQRELSELQMAYYDRFAFPWVCLVAIVLGIPFGVHSDRRGAFLGVANSMALFFAYYFFMKVDYALGQKGHLAPFLAAWLPNLTFGVIGVFLLRRVR